MRRPQLPGGYTVPRAASAAVPIAREPPSTTASTPGIAASSSTRASSEGGKDTTDDTARGCEIEPPHRNRRRQSDHTDVTRLLNAIHACRSWRLATEVPRAL